MMFHGTLNRPALNSFFRRGQFDVTSSVVGFLETTALGESRRTFCCSATSTCRWYTITGSTSVGFRMSPSGGTICHSCVRCCLCQWLSLWIGCCRLPRPAQDRYVRLVLRGLWESRPERPDVPRDRCDRCMWWRHRLGTFRSSRFRILRMCRERWSSTASLRCSRDLSGIGLWSGLPPAVSASVGVPPNENGLSIGGGGGGTQMDWSSRSLVLLH